MSIGWAIFFVIAAVLAFTENGRRVVRNILGRGNDQLSQLADQTKRDPLAVMKDGEKNVRQAQQQVKDNLIEQQADIKGAKRKIAEVERQIAAERDESQRLNALPASNPEQRQAQLKARFHKIKGLEAELARLRKELATLETNASQDKKNLDTLQSSADELSARQKEAASNLRRAESIEATNQAENVTREVLQPDSSIAQAEDAVQQRLARANAEREVNAPLDDGSAELKQQDEDAAFAAFMDGLNKPSGK